MGKVIKVIDLLNMIAKGEETPEDVRYFHNISEQFEVMLVCKENIIDKLDRGIIDLNDKVEILDEEQEIDIQSIEEIDVVGCNIKVGDRIIPTENEINDYNIIKINKLVKAIKQLDNKINKLESIPD